MRSGENSRAKGVRRLRVRFLLAAILGLLAGLQAYLPGANTQARVGIDYLSFLATNVFGPAYDWRTAPVAVIVYDEETHQTPPFVNRPEVAWTPYLGQVIDAVRVADPTVMGIDIVYPTTLDQKDLLPGFDNPYLAALYRARQQNKIVLGDVAVSKSAIVANQKQFAVTGYAANVRSLSLVQDRDSVIRRYASMFPARGGTKIPSFGGELARRSGASLPATDDFLIRFNTGGAQAPTYSFADMVACAANNRRDFFAEHFRGKIVLFGVALDVEDRHVTSLRYTPTPLNDGGGDRCILPANAHFGQSADSHRIPGVMIHAAAITTLLDHSWLEIPTATEMAMLEGTSAAALTLAFFLLEPVAALGLTALVLVMVLGTATMAFRHGLVLPILPLSIAAIGTYTAVYAWRFVVENRAKRRIHHAFRHYLAPALVEELAEHPASLRLGGERRRISVSFSDIAGYTKISEGLAEHPEKLVELVNRYFSLIHGIVERHGGYIDKFMGDAVMSLWGAPVTLPHSERAAVDAAIDAVKALEIFNRDIVIGEYGLKPIGTRFGIGTGVAIVGNMGSSERLNYTVTGDIVNLSSRLESANKAYGTLIMVNNATAKGLGRDYVLRRLDRLIVVGKTVPIAVYEVIGRRAEVSATRLDAIRAFHAALICYYRRDFLTAEARFATLAKDDPVAQLYVDRCIWLMQNPPPARWDRSFEMTHK